MKRFKIIVSDRCFFPRSAFMSTKAVVRLAKSLGYQQVEFHPTWAVCWEVLVRGELSCAASDISSFHIDWRQDRVEEGLSFGKRLKHCPSHLFPFTIFATKTLQILEKQYKKQIVIHWQKNIKEYQRPILELHEKLTVNLKQLEEYFKARKIKGVVIDTHKFLGWMKVNKQGKDYHLMLKRLINNVAEVHFRFKYDEDVKALFKGKATDSIKIMQKLIELGYQNRVVVEAGWPDAGVVANFWKIDPVEAKRIHEKIIGLLRSF